MKGSRSPVRRSGRRGGFALAVAGTMLTAGLAACLDFVEPGTGPGLLQASLTVTDADSARTEFSAHFDPGADPGGSARPVADPSLRILATTLRPTGEGRAGRLDYRQTLTPDAGSAVPDRTTVELRGPRLGGGRPRATVSSPLVGRAGPDTVRLSAGEELALPLRGAPHSVDRVLSRLRWSLSVRSPGGTGGSFSASGTGSLPDTLRVQPGALPGSPRGEPLRAELRVVLSTRVPAGAAGYRAALRVSVRLGWVVVPP